MRYHYLFTNIFMKNIKCLNIKKIACRLKKQQNDNVIEFQGFGIWRRH